MNFTSASRHNCFDTSGDVAKDKIWLFSIITDRYDEQDSLIDPALYKHIFKKGPIHGSTNKKSIAVDGKVISDSDSEQSTVFAKDKENMALRAKKAKQIYYIKK